MKCAIDEFSNTYTLYLRSDNLQEDIALAKIASGLDREKNHATIFTDKKDRVNLQIDFQKGF